MERVQKKWKRIILLEIPLAVSSLIVIAHLFHLGTLESIFICGMGFFLLPAADRCVRSMETKESEYREAVSYMEQFLCSYKRTALVGNTLMDCKMLCSENSELGKTIDQALYILHTGEEVSDHIVGKTLAVIQERYKSRRMGLIHQYVEKADQMGGNVADSIDILMRDLQLWKERQLIYQKKKKFLMRESILSLLMALGLCYLSYLLIPVNFRGELADSFLYKISTSLFIAGLLVLLVKILASASGNWLDTVKPRSKREKQQLEKNYEIVKNRCNKQLSVYFAKKVCRREILQEFPYWILSVLLFLQQDNIFFAVKSSVENVRGIFQRETELFLERLYEDPISLRPYSRFFEEYNLPEIQTGMKLLYSFRTNGYEDTSKQIHFLVEQNNLVMDQVEKRELEDQLVTISFLRQIPMVFAAVKIVLDLFVVLLTVMGRFV